MHINRLLFAILIVWLICIKRVVRARVKRCYVCRSRGPLGDCKDPFEYNTTTPTVDRMAVETQPCASGWCGKSVEGQSDGQHVLATERMCLQRPPSDHKERCGDTIYGHTRKSFFMCFCRGDLCNQSTTGLAYHLPTQLSIILIAILFI
ncbi:uncharacterized protein LOC128957167 [Oppia nitens]|uniref:uncharacterized protein LOC128957167 n=1 Tax=Oppia nitens TaxID=1686743 RepID=UPI0023DC8EEF|nr:uncharacterized protein LOC128957167 [Oppia nitens]